MSELSDAFAELLEAHRRLGSPVPDYVRPGHKRTEVRAAIGAIGLEPSDEVVEYFTLQDGLDAQAWFKTVPADGRHGFLWLCPPFDSPSLQELEPGYHQLRDFSTDIYGPDGRPKADIPQVGYWARTWLPILGEQYTYAADCRGGSTSVVWGRPTHPERSTQVMYPSVSRLVADAAQRLRSGMIVWTEQGFDWGVEMNARDDECARECAQLDPYRLY
jgi:hypothetical protein